MNKVIIAIDGACRGNGKADCISGAGTFIIDKVRGTTRVVLDSECNSTNQRGELLALLNALKYCCGAEKQEEGGMYQIVTDSEYIFNTLTKEWYKGWEANGWLTKAGTPVKNKDLWEKIAGRYDDVSYTASDLLLYHIKGHVIPIGPVTALGIFAKDSTAKSLYSHCLDKFEMVKNNRKTTEMLAKAQKLSAANNGHELTYDVLKDFVAINCTADILANVAVDTQANNQ